MAGSYPFTWRSVSPKDDETVKRSYGELGHCRNMISSEPTSITLTSSFAEHWNLVYNFPIRDDDIWIVTPPKCGTTWTQEITWQIMNDVDLDKISVNLFQRSPFIDMPMIRDMSLEETKEMFDEINQRPSPRLIKTHYPFELLPPNLLDKCKVIFVMRNVKDSCVSFFHHESLMKSHDLNADFLTYAKDIYKPGLCQHGGYFYMLQSGWKRRNHPNMLFNWYEQMKEDQKGMIVKIMKHINYTITENQIDKLDEFMKFENYQKKSSLNQANPNNKEGKGQFIRKGIVGDWRNHFDQETTRLYDEWIESNLKNIGIDDEYIKQCFQIQSLN